MSIKLLMWGIVTNIYQSKTEGHPLRVIQVKKSSSCSPTCGNAFNTTTVESKMAMPSLIARMKKQGNFICCWVYRSQV